jgi:hypothetical protein
MNLFDPPDTSNGYISRQGVREDHSDPTRTINLAKWVVTAPYTDENEEISPPNKKIRTLTVNYERNFRTTTSILRQTLLRPFKIIFPKYFCLNYPREKAIFQTGCLRVCQRLAQYARSDIRGRITRTMAEDLALTCSIVFAGRTTVLRSLLGQRVSRVRECRCCRGSAS